MIFAEFWLKYPSPSKHKGSKANAEKLWNKLDIYEQHAADLSLAVYGEHLAENEWKNPMMVQTYLGPGRHWESFQPSEVYDAEIKRSEERRRETRERNARQDAYAHEQWREKFIQRYGREP